MGNSFMSVSKETEPETNRCSQRTIEIPIRRIHTITHSSSPSKHLTCILCNKTLNISNTNHKCELRPCVDEFSIKFNFI